MNVTLTFENFLILYLIMFQRNLYSIPLQIDSMFYFKDMISLSIMDSNVELSFYQKSYYALQQL